jgi:7-carboxy-7-deazaguanine synthase
MASLRIHEIYRSIQGESSFTGWPCVFVRTAGCDIGCSYCDETQAFSGGERVTVEEVLARICPWDTRLVEVTGGEPLLQRAVPELVRRLLDEGYEVLIETGGHHDISVLDPRAHVILDVKTPGSGVQDRNDLENLRRLGEGDEVKFVLCDRADYEWSRALVRAHRLDSRFPVHFSPVHAGLDPGELVKWLLEDGLRVRLNLQLHKYIWGADARGV